MGRPIKHKRHYHWGRVKPAKVLGRREAAYDAIWKIHGQHHPAVLSKLRSEEVAEDLADDAEDTPF